MLPAEIIAKKRDGEALSEDEISFFIQRYNDERIPDYQMSALAMAILLRGMTDRETSTLTHAMLSSGKKLDWHDGPPVVDKHSTGGIGDKVSLVLAPLLATCGCRVPMISGRGLGPTGGTLDKLESISGFRTDLSIAEIQKQVDKIGCVITGATSEIAPADQKLYALRDITATVESIPLITASIMSKKLAESLDALVLDVKVGNGAFMKSLGDARKLAESLVSVGQRMAVKTTAILSDMSQPLGRMIGNAVEVQESLACLQGNGPSDLRSLTLRLAAQALVEVDVVSNDMEAHQLIQSKLDSGHAYERFQQMVNEQNGSIDGSLAIAKESVVLASRSGYVSEINGRQLGMAVIEMGGGRMSASDSIDPTVGIEMQVRVGDQVEVNQPLARLFSHLDRNSTVHQRVGKAIQVSDSPPSHTPLILETVSGRK